MGDGNKRILAAWCALLACAPAGAVRTSLGVFHGWGAFRDDRPARCFAIAEPAQRDRRAAWRAFASIAQWPGRHGRGQLYIRLRAVKLRGAPIVLTIGDTRFALAAGGANAFAPNSGSDAAIIAAMRSGSSMSVETRDAGGRLFVDAYRLRGAATAMDAAALGCAPSR